MIIFMISSLFIAIEGYFLVALTEFRVYLPRITLLGFQQLLLHDLFLLVIDFTVYE